MNGVSWLQLTLQRAQLLFGENIFTFSGLHVLISVLIDCIIQFTRSLLCLAVLLIMLCFVFPLRVAAELKGHRRARCVSMAACTVLTSWSWYLTKPVELGFTLYDGASIMYDLSWWLYQLLARGACECCRASQFLWIQAHTFWMWTKCRTIAGVLPGFGEQLCLFSCSHEEEYPTTTISLERLFFGIVSGRYAEMKKTCFRAILGDFSIGDFFVFSKQPLFYSQVVSVLGLATNFLLKKKNKPLLWHWTPQCTQPCEPNWSSSLHSPLRCHL